MSIEKKWFEGTKDSSGRTILAPGWVYPTAGEEMSDNFKKYLAEIESLLDFSFERNLAAACVKWIPLLNAHMNENGISDTESPQTFIDSKKLRDLAVYVGFTDLIDFSTAKKKVFPELINNFTEETTWEIIERLGLLEKTDSSEVDDLIDEVLAKYPDKVAAYKAGNKNLAGMFMGEIMRGGKIKANPKELNELIIKKLEE